MADSDITIDSLTVTAGFGQNFLKSAFTDPHASGLLNLSLDEIEYWAATSNNRDAAARAVSGRVQEIHVASDGAARWYWARARNKQGYYSDWYPSSSTGGVAAVQTALVASEGYMRLPNGLIIQWGTANAPGGEVSQYTDITFPIPFPSSAFKVLLGTEADAGLGRAIMASYFSLTTTGFRMQSRAVQNNVGNADAKVLGYLGSGDILQITVSWLALGI